ncbi:hypothetical protein SAMN05216227_10951 [Pseudorhodobacter antarcticus]|jgi:hypothetical protein|uniref:Oxidoreductase molybdopterin-binding domain-containing protein n=1 Tax=Pseudorhodobacter antarcticus TaxID=1077947 RepID=A0A1H8NQ98_9RHOB|nr:molybdopterin-dependent oxidoreductase [Pseudorhodobacter antarcticus]SEO31719.1 hypothetical protein SAMN05216227_10951 [Pseudorhodobacter antarcticus]
MKTFLLRLATAVVILLPSLSEAQTILTRIVSSSDGNQVKTDFTREDLAALPQTTVVTENDYVDTKATFTGLLVRDLFEEGSIKPDSNLVLTALNDYAVTIPASDVLDYDVILATTMDGKEMSVREKGPVWIIYPMSDHEKLRDASYNDRLIWQLSSVELK